MLVNIHKKYRHIEFSIISNYNIKRFGFSTWSSLSSQIRDKKLQDP